MARLPIKCYLYSEKNKITVIVLKTEKSRIDAVDALRGFAVMAILLVHSLDPIIKKHSNVMAYTVMPFWNH